MGPATCVVHLKWKLDRMRGFYECANLCVFKKMVSVNWRDLNSSQDKSSSTVNPNLKHHITVELLQNLKGKKDVIFT